MRSMRFLDQHGRVAKQLTFTCGQCGRDATPNVEFRADAPPLEHYEVKCPHCGYVCGHVNPRTGAALSAPPGAAADPDVQAAADARTAELEHTEAETRDDMNLEANVAESQRPPRA